MDPLSFVFRQPLLRRESNAFVHDGDPRDWLRGVDLLIKRACDVEFHEIDC